jgi:nucleotide-binding universal stress UspA family protein
MIPAPNGRDDQVGGDGGPFRRVLVAWDGSPDSVTALKTAAALVGGGAGHVVALAVLQGHPQLEGGAALEDGDSGEAARMREDFNRVLASITARSRTRIDLHTTTSHQVGRSLCAYAIEHGFDLLVLGRHGDGGVLHPRLGRVAEAAVKASQVPVLLVSRD